MAEQEAGQTQAQVPQDCQFGLLAKFAEGKSALERFEQGLNLPAASAGLFGRLRRSLPGGHEEPLFPRLSFLGGQPDPVKP
ncbi:hypothetical protein Q0M94_24565 (plasmid) [Deinococcus radiomollis]